jgi:acetoin utilization deacetylase AcuC-like enzyme
VCAELGILRSHDFKDLRWDTGGGCASIGDVLRVHDWAYVRDLQNACATLASSGAADADASSGAGSDGTAGGGPPPSNGAANVAPAKPEAIGHLDGDTAISGGSFRAALAAAGAVIRAVDSVVAGEVRARPCIASIASCCGMDDPTVLCQNKKMDYLHAQPMQACACMWR